MLDVMWIWTGFGLIGIGLAFALRYGLDRTAEEEQSEPIEACERLLRRLRTQGLDEEEIQHFVAKFAGREWEGFFEALFGYEAKLAARAVLLRGGAAGVREKHGAWREPLIAAMDRVEKSRRAAQERKLLQAVERAELLAAGATPAAAEKRARAAAEAMVRAADDIRESERERALRTPRPACPPTSMFTRLSWRRKRIRTCSSRTRNATRRARSSTCSSVRTFASFSRPYSSQRAACGSTKTCSSSARSRRHGSLEIAGVPAAATHGWTAGTSASPVCSCSRRCVLAVM